MSGFDISKLKDAIKIKGDSGNVADVDGDGNFCVKLVGPADEKVKVSANDTTEGYLIEKVIAADETNTTSAIEIKEVNDGANEDLKIAFDESKITITESQISDLSHTTDTDELVKVSSNDTTAKYLEDAVVTSVGTNATTALEKTTLNDGADEDVQIQFDETKITITESQISDLSHTVNTDEKFKVSPNDTTADYAINKIIAADESNTTSAIEIKEVNDGGDEDIKVAFDETKVDHDALLNFVADEHHASGSDNQNLFESVTGDTGTATADTQTDSLKIAGGDGITTVAADDPEVLTVDVDINPETLVTVASTDEVLIADASDSFNIKKVTAQDIADLAPGGNSFGIVTGDTGTATADTPTDTLDISGGVAIKTTASDGPEDVLIDFDIPELTAESTVDGAADHFVMYDASAGAHRKVLGDDLPGGGAAGDMAAVMTIRTTRYFFTTSWVPLTYDTTDVENEPTIIEHNNTTTSRIDIKEDGLYRLEFNTSFEQDSLAGNYYLRFRKNGTTTLGDSERAYNRGAPAGGIRVDFTAMSNIVAELVDGDYVEVEVKKDSGDPNDSVEQGAIFSVVKLQGPTGDAGADGADGANGATGSGSNIIVQDEGVNVTGTPHDELNFVGSGVTVTDGGSGTATITIGGGTFGSEYQFAESLAESTTTSSTPIQKLRMTTTSLPAGDYYVSWSADVGNTTSDREFNAQFEEDDTTMLSHLDIKVKEGAAGAGPEIPFSGHAIRTLSGVHTFDIDFWAGTATAKITNARIVLWRVS